VKAHHLNCGTMRMPTVPTLVSHVLLLETDAGLVLVDTGFGLEDIAGLARRLGWFRQVIRPVFSAEETPARQAGRLGFT
jgi:glyoxylase-like metal-dependent hydrolase (beta-lactamase superfamily II)